MPTGAKLVAAVIMAIACMLVMLVIVEVHPVFGRSIGPMLTTSAIVGVLVGWRVLGKVVVTDEGSGAVSGLRAAVVAGLWILGLFALDAMIAGILKNSYYDPMTAVLQIPAHMIVYARMAFNIPITGAILLLAVIAGVIVKRASLKWL